MSPGYLAIASQCLGATRACVCVSRPLLPAAWLRFWLYASTALDLCLCELLCRHSCDAFGACGHRSSTTLKSELWTSQLRLLCAPHPFLLSDEDSCLDANLVQVHLLCQNDALAAARRRILKNKKKTIARLVLCHIASGEAARLYDKGFACRIRCWGNMDHLHTEISTASSIIFIARITDAKVAKFGLLAMFRP